MKIFENKVSSKQESQSESQAGQMLNPTMLNPTMPNLGMNGSESHSVYPDGQRPNHINSKNDGISQREKDTAEEKLKNEQSQKKVLLPEKTIDEMPEWQHTGKLLKDGVTDITNMCSTIKKSMNDSYESGQQKKRMDVIKDIFCDEIKIGLKGLGRCCDYTMDSVCHIGRRLCSLGRSAPNTFDIKEQKMDLLELNDADFKNGDILVIKSGEVFYKSDTQTWESLGIFKKEENTNKSKEQIDNEYKDKIRERFFETDFGKEQKKEYAEAAEDSKLLGAGANIIFGGMKMYPKSEDDSNKSNFLKYEVQSVGEFANDETAKQSIKQGLEPTLQKLQRNVGGILKASISYPCDIFKSCLLKPAKILGACCSCCGKKCCCCGKKIEKNTIEKSIKLGK